MHIGTVDAKGGCWVQAAVHSLAHNEAEVFVANVPLTVAVVVALIRVGNRAAVISGVGDTIPINVRVAGVSQAVAVGIALIGVPYRGTVVPAVSDEVAVSVGVAYAAGDDSLIAVGDQRQLS